MTQLNRGECFRKHSEAGPIAEKSPWRAAVASILKRKGISEAILFRLLRKWPGPEYLARADAAELMFETRLRRRIARLLIRLSTKWFGRWNDMRELPGVSSRVADAVAEVCFKENTDEELDSRTSLP